MYLVSGAPFPLLKVHKNPYLWATNKTAAPVQPTLTPNVPPTHEPISSIILRAI
jgi:hypothetical protein